MLLLLLLRFQLLTGKKADTCCAVSQCLAPSVTVTSPGRVSVCSDATEQLMTYYVDTTKRVNISVTPANCQANVTKGEV